MDFVDSDDDSQKESNTLMNNLIKNGIGTIMKELYGYLFIPFLIIILFLIFHIFELYSLIKLINKGIPPVSVSMT